MKSRWNDDDAARYVKAALASGHGEELRLRIYSSRIIGGDRDLSFTAAVTPRSR